MSADRRVRRRRCRRWGDAFDLGAPCLVPRCPWGAVARRSDATSYHEPGTPHRTGRTEHRTRRRGCSTAVVPRPAPARDELLREYRAPHQRRGAAPGAGRHRPDRAGDRSRGAAVRGCRRARSRPPQSAARLRPGTASAPRGSWQPPPSAATTARSASTLTAVGCIVRPRQDVVQRRVVLARFHSDDTLAGCGHAHGYGKHGGDADCRSRAGAGPPTARTSAS